MTAAAPPAGAAAGGGDCAAALTVEGALRGAGLGPVLDMPVGAVLRNLGLPALPAPPPLPPLPGLPPLPVLDPSALLKPLTDLLGAFGTGDLAGAGDPTKIFSGLSSLLDLTISGTTTALKALDKAWAGTAATSAATKMGRTAVESGAVAKQGTGMSFDITAAAGIVAGGLAALQAVIVKTVGLVGAAMPFICTPPGQAAALAAIGAGMTEGMAVIAATKAQLLAPTAKMIANGAPVPISGAPAGAGTSGFALAATALEAAATPLKAATGVLGSVLAAAAKTGSTGATKQLTPRARDIDPRRPGDPALCPTAARTAPAGVGATGLGRGIATGGTGREITARYAARTPAPGGTGPAGLAAVAPPVAPAGAAVGPGAAVAPMGGAGALGGAHAIGRVVGGPHLAIKSDDAVADCDSTCAPPVFGAAEGTPQPDDPTGGDAGSRLDALKAELLS
ncbi:MAG: hypothetical protein QM728_11140 [Gordonia sp. (in: high G+C Gram-positive bacteria)]|uniref:hypothetical protein n=1 Tax=Gordonia sp. (in: high G+C Gram-positive bacteria) TaxID=84139 RepID=UPI0039E38996